MAILRILILSLFSVYSYSATIYFDNGVSVYVPESTWTVQPAPKGFNTAPYSEDNPKGKLPFLGGWPNYKSCSGELSLGGLCEEPYFITFPQPPVCTNVPGTLSLGGC